ncbi:MAG: S53 family peptidase [Acidimicrobiales bacterium]|jgi:subtilase family serine protease
MQRFASGSIGGRLLPLAAAAIVALGVAAAAPSAATATATHRAISGHMIPAIGAHPVIIKAGVAGQTTFSCQPIGSPVRCYSPQQLIKAYGWNSFRNRGKGETIVIIDSFQSPTLLQDVQLEDSTFDLPAPHLTIVAPQGLTPFDPTNGDMVGWSAEISLDVESAHAYAPAANIVLDLAKSDQDSDILAATKYAIDNNLGDVISQSFGEAEACLLPNLAVEEHHLFQKAVGEGITLVASSGDNGAAQPNCTGTGLVLSASTPASDPDVTAVGGTNVFLTNGGSWTGETAWNDGFGESGGGLSSRYPTPDYQKKLGAPSRAVPDVAYNAGVNGGILIAWGSSGDGTGLLFIFGGTSCGSPAWAALAAVADQQAGHRLGNLNPTLYKLGEGKSYSSDFHDITIGDNIESVGGYSTAPGYDLVTGWGTPKLASLMPALAAGSGS